MFVTLQLRQSHPEVLLLSAMRLAEHLNTQSIQKHTKTVMAGEMMCTLKSVMRVTSKKANEMQKCSRKLRTQKNSN